GEGELMAHDVPLGCAPDEYDDLISGTCSHLPKLKIRRAFIFILVIGASSELRHCCNGGFYCFSRQ
ncbi:hypothetical protein, partial [Escherichia coli]|uniref:hypothetical protein n=1 Tax=Escherichia coli TaxID=562 RepID=UPI0020CDD1CC